MMGLVDNVLGLSLKSEELGYGQMAARALVMYVALITWEKAVFGGRYGLRLYSCYSHRIRRRPGYDRRFALFSLNTSDRGSHRAALVFFPALSCRSTTFSQLIKGNATPLIHGGKLDKRALAQAHMSGLRAQLHQGQTKTLRPVTGYRSVSIHGRLYR